MCTFVIVVCVCRREMGKGETLVLEPMVEKVKGMGKKRKGGNL